MHNSTALSYIINLNFEIGLYEKATVLSSKNHIFQRIKECIRNALNYFNKYKVDFPIKELKTTIHRLDKIDSELANSLRTLFKGTKRPHDAVLPLSLIEKGKNLQNSFNQSLKELQERPSKMRRIDSDMNSETIGVSHSPSSFKTTQNISAAFYQKIEQMIGLMFFKKNYDEIERNFLYSIFKDLKKSEFMILHACLEIQSKEKDFFRSWSRELLETLAANRLSERRKTLMDYLESLFKEQKKLALVDQAMTWIEMCLTPLSEYQELSQFVIANCKNGPNLHALESLPRLKDIKYDLSYIVNYYCPSLANHMTDVHEMIDQTSDGNALMLLKEILLKENDISYQHLMAVLNFKTDDKQKEITSPTPPSIEAWMTQNDSWKDSNENYDHHPHLQEEVIDDSQLVTPMKQQTNIVESSAKPSEFTLKTPSLQSLASKSINIPHTHSSQSNHSLPNTQHKSDESINKLASDQSLKSKKSELTVWLKCKFVIEDIVFIDQIINGISDVNVVLYILNNRTNGTFNSLEEILNFIYH
jgi:hypothetical protein